MVENSAFGMETRVRSRVRIRVERMPISSTVPTSSPKRQKSPTRTGASATSVMPPKRFSRVFCAARATARPPTPRPATSAVTFTPKLWSAKSRPITRITKRPMRRSSGKSPEAAGCPRATSCCWARATRPSMIRSAIQVKATTQTVPSIAVSS